MTALTPQRKLDILLFTTAPVIPVQGRATPEQLQRILDADPGLDVYGYMRDEFGRYAACFLTEAQAAQVIEWIERAECYVDAAADWQVNR